MSENLSIKGSLSETTVPDLFRTVIRSGETACVSLELPDRHDSIYFKEGEIVFASSTDPDLGLAEVLLTAGDLSLAQYQTALDKAGTSRQIGAVMCELRFLSPESLPRAIENQIARIVRRSVFLSTGDYTIEFLGEFPDDVLALSIETERMILDALRQIDQWSIVSKAIGDTSRLLRLVEGSDTKAYYLDLSEEESHVLGLASDPQTIETMCERSYLSNFVVCRLIWSLLVLNLLEDAQADKVDERRAAVETEYKLEAEVEKFNSAFQKIYNLVFQEIGDYSYDFVDRVVARMSPQTLPYLSGMNLIVNESRVDFDQLLNNLVSSGAENHPQMVQDVMNELLYAWILEIRLEFEDKLEAPLSAVLAELKR